MLSSVRIRLTLWYTAAMTVILVVLAAATYVVLARNVIHRADANATELANSFLATVDAEMRDAGSPGLSQSVGAALSEHQFRDVTFVVLGPQGDLLGLSESDRPFGAPEDLNRGAVVAPLRSLLSSPADPFRNVRVAERRYRSYVHPFMVTGHSATLIVLQSLRRQNEFLETLARTFVIVIPMAILLAGTGGYLLARRSLSPVVMMSTQ